MVTEQETLIYIEDKDKFDASVAANSFAHDDVKNRAYINTLGAELALKYLKSENINIKDIHNIHSIKKILEEIDISDIMLPNIHIDVRVVFDEKALFIPKSHFEYNLVPDIYLVFQLAKDFEYVKFLGFFEPKLINKNNQNDKYYFIEKEKLNSPKDLKKYIEAFSGNTNSLVSENEIEDSERIIMAMSDNDISENEKKLLIKQLTKSAELRDKFIEYESFETLSYKASNDSRIHRKENDTPNIIEENNKILEDISSLENIDDININDTDIVDTSMLEENVDSTISDQEIEIVEDENINNEISSQDSDSNVIGDVANAITEGAIATGLGIAGEKAEEIINETGAVLDTVDSIASNVKDIVTDNSIENKIDSLQEENFESSNSEEMNTVDEQNENQLENIDLEEVNIDDNIENNISNEENIINDTEQNLELNDFENVDLQENQDIIAEENNEVVDLEDIQIDDVVENQNSTEENIISDANQEDELSDFENVNLQENQNMINEENDEVVDLEDIQIDDVVENQNSTEENIISDSNQEDELSDFENVNLQENQNMVDEENNEVVDLENIQIDDVVENQNSTEETYNKNSEQITNEENIEENSQSQETIEDNIEETNSQEFDNNDIDSLDEISDFMDDIMSLDDNPSDVNLSDNEQFEGNKLNDEVEKHDSFGKNLLENLVTSDSDNITIQNSQLNNENNENTENISSEDLLSEVDNILNSNNPVDENTLTSEVQEEDFSENVDELNNSFSEENEEDNIEVLFNDTDPNTDAELDSIEETSENELEQIPGAAFIKAKQKSNKNVLVAAVTLATIVAAISAVMIFKPKADESVEAITPQDTESTVTDNNILSTKEMNDNTLATNAPSINKDEVKNIKQKAQSTKELKSTPVKPKQQMSNSYLEVNKLVWDVPSSLSYSQNFQNYLRTAGKSIKLSLSADLLLASEYAYTNKVKVNLTLNQKGEIQSSNIVSSSGSKQIDEIVLRSVKETLNVVKPASSDVKTPTYNLGLIIYF